MLQIDRVEADTITSTPAYCSLLSGFMATVSATVLDLYFENGKLSPGIFAWIQSLRSMLEPNGFSHDSVVRALPAISTAWSTLLFIISIVPFTF